jgi:hypothetical protein
MDDRLVRRAVEVNWRHLPLGHDVFEADGATFVRKTRVALEGYEWDEALVMLANNRGGLS